MLSGLALQLAWMDAAQTALAGPRRLELAVLGGPGAANRTWWRLKQRLVPGDLRQVDAASAGRDRRRHARRAPRRRPHHLAAPAQRRRLSPRPAIRPCWIAFVEAATRHDKEPE
ncbi:hypothetical protein ACRAWC_22705 [Leifsonia sp. L25]|uniref:hypothetical protein n=1 Tax=Leifsonia sp. L25 TaxID=3423957 RepID=UPI003D680FDE